MEKRECLESVMKIFRFTIFFLILPNIQVGVVIIVLYVMPKSTAKMACLNFLFGVW